MDKRIESYCGLKCSECSYKEPMGCKGCIDCGGKPFWGECEVASCAIGRGRRFCGECGDFACEKLKAFAYDKEQGDNGARLENCTALKLTLVAEAREGINPVGNCGHHCDHCFLGKWCGGCRSSYNCCSYATVSEGGVCENVKCTLEKGYEGCWECPDLDGCSKGYYSITKEFSPKAKAKFIAKYGQQRYSQLLNKLADMGEQYLKDFDAQDSVENALAYLEKYL